VASGELPPQPVWASQAVDLITGLRPAADLVADITAQAENALTRALGFSCPDEALLSLSPAATVIGGRIAYRAVG
jgi:nitronate monooxygenase